MFVSEPGAVVSILWFVTTVLYYAVLKPQQLKNNMHCQPQAIVLFCC